MIGGRADQPALHLRQPGDRQRADLHLRRAAGAGRRASPARCGARRGQGRPGRDLHADGARGRRRDAGVRPHRRGALGGVRRVRAGRAGRAGSTTPGPRWSSRRPAASSRPGWSSTSRCSTRRIERAGHAPRALRHPAARAGRGAAGGERDVDWDDVMRRAPTRAGCVPVAATDPLYILYTSGTTGQPKGIVRDNGGHAVALAWSMRNIYDIGPARCCGPPSDVGWVVGHSYIVYAPLLAGCTTVLYEGKPVGTPDAGAFWRVIAEHGVTALFTAPTAIRAIKKEDPDGELMAGTTCPAADAVPGRRAARPRHLRAGPASGSACRWSTTGGRPRPAGRSPRTCAGLEPLPIKPGSPTRAGARLRRRVLDERGERVPARRRGRDLPAAADAAGHAADPVGGRRAVRRVVPVGVRRLLPDRRRRLHRRGRLPVRHGPHRRRASTSPGTGCRPGRWRRCSPGTPPSPSAR